MAGGRTVAQSGGKAASPNERRHRELQGERSMPTRRDFVTSTLVTSTFGAGALLAMGPRKAAAQADRRQIVDAQVHL